ncbi:MAG: acetylglutamate kinase, partial [Methanobrevibacter sp.]|nr:acetylglutamate kinase [Methanobrevibacter sp.]
MNDIDVLVEALPFIKEFYCKKILIKYGGHAMIDDEAKSSTARDTVLLKYVGMEPIIVHGGGPEISRSMEKLGKESKFIKGLRVTDEETMEIIEMVLAGKISSEIVSELIKHDTDAISLSGKDSRLIYAHKKPVSKIDDEIVDLGLVGEVDEINTE